MQRYADFQRRYRDMPTEQLLRIRLTTELVPEARMALDAELENRSDEIEADPPDVYVGPTNKPTSRFKGVVLWIALALVGALTPIIWPYWQTFFRWLTG